VSAHAFCKVVCKSLNQTVAIPINLQQQILGRRDDF
jgi:hypothetical protein